MTKTIFLAGGCFWGTQHYLKQINGVLETQTGFANGNSATHQRSGADGVVVEHPTYEQVYTDRTGYAETVRVVYDPDVLPLRRLVELYFLCIEPTSLNRQGEDEGTRYRTGIYYIDPEDYGTIDDVYREVQQPPGGGSGAPGELRAGDRIPSGLPGQASRRILPSA